MKTIDRFRCLSLISICLLSYSCADKEQAIKYQEMRIETTKLISQIDFIIQDQKVKFDSLNNLGNDYVMHRISEIDIDAVHKATINSIDLQESMTKLKLRLESINLYCTILEKANTRIGYLMKRRNKIKWDYSKLIYDTYNEISNITGGLTAQDYIYKYLPKENK